VKKFLEAQSLHCVTTNVEQLQAFIDTGNATEFCSTLLEHRKHQKSYSTYVKGMRKRHINGRIYSTFLLHGTVTGRLSSRNPNLQNVTRGSVLRAQFVPDTGNVFVQGDYGQAELRVMATLSQDERLKDALTREGRTVHEIVAERFFGPGFTKEQYVRAKAVVYGLSYGREAFSLGQEFKISTYEAQQYLDTVFKEWPAFNDWRAGVQRHILEESDDLVTPFGRHRRFWLVTRDNKKDVLKEGLAFLPQSTSSDICLSALIRLRRCLPQEAHVRIPVHDSILVECPQDSGGDIRQLVQGVMQDTAKEVFTDWIPFPVDVKVGNNWAEVS
jgi:DNA polymerase-1